MANHGSYNILQDISAPHQFFSRVNYNYKMLVEGVNLNAEPSRSLFLNKSAPVEEKDMKYRSRNPHSAIKSILYS